MIDADSYLQGLKNRLAADGCKVTHEPLGLVGYRADMRAIVRAHVFLVAAKAMPSLASSATTGWPTNMLTFPGAQAASAY